MNQMWVTPIYKSNVFDLPGFPELKSLASFKHMQDTVLQRYEQAHAISANGMSSADNLYPVDQLEELTYKKCIERLETCQPVYSFRYQLIELFYSELTKYLAVCGLTDMPIPKRSRDVDLAFSMWASVHANSSYHLAHHHEGSMVSGVLYVATPPGSGDFVAHDPKGQLPPFGRSQHFPPRLGDLLLFPGWLMHSVLPTLSADPRVSISFNFAGSWTSTTDINQAFLI